VSLDGCSQVMNVDSLPQLSYPSSPPKDRSWTLTGLHQHQAVSCMGMTMDIERKRVASHPERAMGNVECQQDAGTCLVTRRNWADERAMPSSCAMGRMCDVT
jgi:hypothetical protein